MIHALRYTEDLEKAGFSPEQAKASVKIWMDLMSDNFATRSDLKEHQFITRNDLRDHQQFFAKELAKMNVRFGEIDKHFGEIDKHFSEIDQRFREMDLRFEQMEQKFLLMESKLTVKLGSIMVIGIGLLGALKLV